MRETVQRGYEEGKYPEIYRSCDEIARYPFEKRNIEALVRLLPERAKVLDLGCGPGIPFDTYLVKKGFELVGVDISRKHVAMAQKHVPEAIFIRADMSILNFVDESFDAVLSLYAIFHVPKEEHEKILFTINHLLKERGLILLSMGAERMEADRIEDFVGSKMAWSSFSMEDNIQMVRDCGFEIIRLEEEGSKGEDEHHIWILGRKAT